MSSDESSSEDEFVSGEEEPTTLSDSSSDEESTIKPTGDWKATTSPTKSTIKTPSLFQRSPVRSSPVKSQSPDKSLVKSPPAQIEPNSSKSHSKNPPKNVSKNPLNESNTEGVESKKNKRQRSANNITSYLNPEEEGDFAKGQKLLVTMTDSDIEFYLSRIDQQLPTYDTKMSLTRVKMINWEEVAFKQYNAEMCRYLWSCLKKYARPFRVMGELVKEIQVKLKDSKGKQDFYTAVAKNTEGFPKTTSAHISAFHAFSETLTNERKKLEKDGNSEKYGALLKIAKEKYDSLSEREKQKWIDINQEALASYRKDLEEFYKTHPTFAQRKFKNKTLNPEFHDKTTSKEKKILNQVKKKAEFEGAPALPRTAFELYVQSKMKRKDASEFLSRVEYRTNWTKASDGKKYKFINRALKAITTFETEVEEFQKTNPAYVNPLNALRLSKVLTKDEVKIWMTFNGAPEKPPVAPYKLFFNELKEKEEYSEFNIDQMEDEANRLWRELDWYQKEMYGLQFKEVNLTYRRQMAEFYANAPEMLRPAILLQVPLKLKAGVLGVPKVPSETGTSKRKKRGKKNIHDDLLDEPMIDDDTTDEEEETKKKKKRKRKEVEDLEKSEKKEKTKRRSEETKMKKMELVKLEGVDPLDTYKRNIHSDKPEVDSREFQEPIKKPEITISEVIRGIFEGRQTLGRAYSVYYYYGKYVCKDPLWAKSLKVRGIYPTAVDIAKTFISLSKPDKQIFVDQSYSHYIDRTYGCYKKYDPNEVLGDAKFNAKFYGEPMAPPRTAKHVYEREIRRQLTELKRIGQKPQIFPGWNQLNENDQIHYINKLYYESAAFAQEFNDFIYRLSPSELVEYCVEKSRNWEIKSITDTYLKRTAKGFVFPFQENPDYDEEPEVLEDDDYKKILSIRSNRRTNHKGKDKDRAIEDLSKSYEIDLEDPPVDVENSSDDDQTEHVEMKILNKSRTPQHVVDHEEKIDSLYVSKAEVAQWQRNARSKRTKRLFGEIISDSCEFRKRKSRSKTLPDSEISPNPEIDLTEENREIDLDESGE